MRRPLPKTLAKLMRSTRGATVVEYGLILACVTLGLIGALQVTGNGSRSMWSSIEDKVTDAM